MIPRPLAALLLVSGLMAAAPARADVDAGVTTADAGSSSDSSREDEMFGGSSSAPATPSTPQAPQQTQVLTGTNPGDANALLPIDEKAIAREADAQNDKLVVGGLMYLQMQYTLNQGQAFEKGLLTSPNLLDVYLDARPNDDLRVYVRGRLEYNPSLTGGTTNQISAFGTLGQSSCSDLCPYLDQFWMKWNIGHKVFFTLGRQHIKWGAGHFWNPTDFLNPQKLNPLDVIDQRLGVDMLKIHIPVESKSFNFYGIVYLDGVSNFEQIGYAGRAEFAAGPTEITASVDYQNGQPLKLGSDISFGLGDFDGHVEGAVLHPIEPGQITSYTTNPSFEITGFPSNIMVQPVQPQSLDRQNEWLPQVVAGGEYSLKYSDQDALVLGAEYFFNSIGYSNANAYPALFFTNNFTPLYTGRNYAAAYLSLPNPGDWNNTTFMLTWLGNLSDKSYVARFDYRVTVLTYLQVNAYASYAFGNDGELHFSYSLSSTQKALVQEALGNNWIPAQYKSFASELLSGIQAPVLTLGAGMILNM